MENLNGHVGSLVDGFEGVHGSYGLAQKKQEVRILEWADNFDMVVGNAYFKKDAEKFFKSGCNSTTVCYILVKKRALSLVRDIKVISGKNASHKTSCMC